MSATGKKKKSSLGEISKIQTFETSRCYITFGVIAAVLILMIAKFSTIFLLTNQSSTQAEYKKLILQQKKGQSKHEDEQVVKLKSELSSKTDIIKTLEERISKIEVQMNSVQKESTTSPTTTRTSTVMSTTSRVPLFLKQLKPLVPTTAQYKSSESTYSMTKQPTLPDSTT